MYKRGAYNIENVKHGTRKATNDTALTCRTRRTVPRMTNTRLHFFPSLFPSFFLRRYKVGIQGVRCGLWVSSILIAIRDFVPRLHLLMTITVPPRP